LRDVNKQYQCNAGPSKHLVDKLSNRQSQTHKYKNTWFWK
jgi:hypothetical protein